MPRRATRLCGFGCVWRKTGYRFCRAGSGVGGMTRATSKAVPGPPALAGFKPHSQFKGICFIQTVHETTGDGLNGCTERAPQGFFDFGGQSHVLNGRYVVFVGSRAWSLPDPVVILGASSQLNWGCRSLESHATPCLCWWRPATARVKYSHTWILQGVLFLVLFREKVLVG